MVFAFFFCIFIFFFRDTKKKKYVKGTLTETGKLKKDKEDKNMKEEKGKKLFKKWSKRHMLSFQNDGETEDARLTSKAKNLFQNRRRNNFSSDHQENNENQGGFKNFNRNKGKNQKNKGRNELRTPNQMIKVLKINKYSLYFCFSIK